MLPSAQGAQKETGYKRLGAIIISVMRINDADHLTGEQRIHLALLLSQLEIEITKARLREENPAWSEKRVTIEIFRIAFLPQPLPKWLERQFMADCEQFRPVASATQD